MPERAIWKFPLEICDEQTIKIPDGYRPLSVQDQKDHPCLWAIVDPNAPRKDQTILTVGTGHPFDYYPDIDHHLGTYQLAGGALVFHVFARDF